MKIKTALISIVISASLIAGGLYGARYMLNSQKKPVEVVPVSNVNTGYWGMTNSLYGVITSQVAQRVVLDEEYPIEEIFVDASGTGAGAGGIVAALYGAYDEASGKGFAEAEKHIRFCSFIWK